MDAITLSMAGSCEDWDVRLTSYPTGEPEIFLDGSWHGICGFAFWYGNGPQKICTRLGYTSGSVNHADSSSSHYPLTKDSFFIGTCLKSGETGPGPARYSGPDQWGLKHRCTGGLNVR